MRDEIWLQETLDRIWDAYFSDVPQDNDVRIVFGRRAKRRLGSISLDPLDRRTSVVTMNGLFKERIVPDFVIDATIVHELIHYSHGFNSPLSQNRVHPHAGGLMRREFTERGLSELYIRQKNWLKENWSDYISQSMSPQASTKKRISSTIKIAKPNWFI